MHGGTALVDAGYDRSELSDFNTCTLLSQGTPNNRWYGETAQGGHLLGAVNTLCLLCTRVHVCLCVFPVAVHTNVQPLDLVICFPSQHSMTAYDFQQFKWFCMQMIRSLQPSASTGGSRVSIILYSDVAQVIFDSAQLSDTTLASLLAAIESIAYTPPASSAADSSVALQWAENRLVTTPTADTHPCMLFATGDGVTVDSSSVTLATSLKSSQVELYTLAVGSAVATSSQLSLASMASSPAATHYYQAASYSALPATSTTFQLQMIHERGWGFWSVWSSCTASCGGGQQWRERTCISNSAGGCQGLNRAIGVCNNQTCEPGEWIMEHHITFH
eukprot:scpid87151/ scgid3424/ 